MRLRWWCSVAVVILASACSSPGDEPDLLTRVTDTVAARFDLDEDCVRPAAERLSPGSLEAIAKLFGALDDGGQEYEIDTEAVDFIDDMEAGC